MDRVGGGKSRVEMGLLEAQSWLHAASLNWRKLFVASALHPTPLNASHFCTPLQAQAAAAQSFPEGPRSGTGLGDGGGSRKAIAAVACAAAAAAGLPDPGAIEDEPLSPMQLDEPPPAAPMLAAALAAAAAAEGEEPADGNREASSPAVAAAAVANGGPLDSAVLQQVLSAMQGQMQKLITLEERRAVDIVRLNAKVRA